MPRRNADRFELTPAETSLADSRYARWLARLVTWDGLLPAAIILAPRAARALPFGNGAVEVILGVFVPITAFMVRARRGQQTFLEERRPGWQLAVFFLALLMLLFFEALSAVFTLIPRGIQARDWRIVWGMFVVYFTLAAIAFFPLDATADDVDDSPASPPRRQ